MVHVAKYTNRPMDPMGINKVQLMYRDLGNFYSDQTAE